MGLKDIFRRHEDQPATDESLTPVETKPSKGLRAVLENLTAQKSRYFYRFNTGKT